MVYNIPYVLKILTDQIILISFRHLKPYCKAITLAIDTVIRQSKSIWLRGWRDEFKMNSTWIQVSMNKDKYGNPTLPKTCKTCRPCYRQNIFVVQILALIMQK